jgi:hypothetical protein
LNDFTPSNFVPLIERSAQLAGHRLHAREIMSPTGMRYDAQQRRLTNVIPLVTRQ